MNVIQRVRWSTLGSLLLLFTSRLILAQESFDYASYRPCDLDSLIVKVLRERNTLTKESGITITLDIVAPEKLKLEAYFQGGPTPIGPVSSEFQVPHKLAFKAIGWTPPPAANYLVRVRSLQGRELDMPIQDVLVQPLKDEITVGAKVTLYCLLFYYTPSGPGLLINGFAAAEQSDTLTSQGLAALQQQDYDRATALFTRVLQQYPKDAGSYVNRGMAYHAKRAYAQTVADYQAAIQLDSTLIEAYNNLAYVLATCAVDSIRNGAQALAYAKKACELTHWQEVFLFDTLAAAYAEVGAFEEAIKWQQRALAAPDAFPPEALPALRQHLQRYQARQPCREP